MSWSTTLPLVVLTACSFRIESSRGQVDARLPDAQDIDAALDAAPVGCTPWAWTPSNVAACAAGLVGEPLSPGTGTYDTTNGMLTFDAGGSISPFSMVVAQAGGGSVRVLSLAGLTIAELTTLRVTGDHPLIVLVHGDAVIEGTIDVSAQSTSVGGPGANDGNCGTGVGQAGGAGRMDQSVSGGGGGGGGGFSRNGGSGGNNAGDNGEPGARGTTAAALLLEPLRGGCSGGTGGVSGVGPSGAGAGGGAGGALQLSVRDSLQLRGELRSAGAGGAPGTNVGGGGGGGSGGGLVVEGGSVVIAATAKLCANGGSGGEGGAGIQGGAPGVIGTCSRTLGAATPNVTLNGGDGGTGGYRDGNNGGSGTTGGDGIAGGGGGGSVGVIRIQAETPLMLDAAAIISPQHI